MPDIRQQSTVDALATAFAINGRKQEQAMIDVGYKPAYANSYCGKLWDDSRVIAAIARIDGKTAEKMEYSIEKYREELDEAKALATKLNQPSAVVSAVVAKGRSCGYDKDVVKTTIDAPTLTPAEKEAYEQAAQQIKLKLA